VHRLGAGPVRGGFIVKYRTRIVATGANTTGIPVPDEVMASLGSGKRPAVVVTIGGHAYRSSVATVGGGAMISLSAENRTKAGVAAGDDVEVEVELDTAPRTVEVPGDLGEALDSDAAARRTWEGLSSSKQRWHVLSVEGAKTEATRQRRIASSIAALRDGRDR
jgi:hypothetical protein